MESEATLELPLIDLSSPNLHPGTPEWNLAKTQVQKALEEYGCFKVISSIPEELQSEVVASFENVFDLPLEAKTRKAFASTLLGYQGQSPSAPLSESISFLKPYDLESVDAITLTFWPDGNLNFSKTIQSISIKAMELEKLVRGMILENLGLDKYIEEQMNSTDYILRIMKYHTPNSAEKALGVGAHNDINVMTILYDNGVKGLEVQPKDGNQLIPIKPAPGSFTVMIGECLTAWTNGRLLAPLHAVNISGYTVRYAMAIHSSYKKGYLVKVPEELVDEEHPLRFKPFDFYEYGSYLNVPSDNKASNVKKSIFTFAGVAA